MVQVNQPLISKCVCVVCTRFILSADNLSVPLFRVHRNMSSSPSSCVPFDAESESIQKFFQRYQCSMAEPLYKVRNDLKNDILVKFLPVNIVSVLQRRLSPTLL